MTLPSASKATALLVIDLQVGMFNGEKIAPMPGGEALLARVAGLQAEARRAGIPVIHVRHGDPPDDLLTRGTDNWQIHPMVAPVPGELIIDKATPDSFHDTELQSLLATKAIRRLIV